MYRYSGPIEAGAIKEWMFESDLAYSLIHRNLEQFVVENEEELRKEQMSQMEGERPSFASQVFDELFRTPISFIFYHIGKDHYSKSTKISLFCLLLLVPFTLFILSLLWNFCFEDDEHPPTLVPANPQAVH